MSEEYIYYYAGWFNPWVHKYKVLREMPKTLEIQRTNWSFRLHKKKIEKKEWDGGFYSFDLQKVLLAAHQGIVKLESEFHDKMEKIKNDLEQFENET